MSVRRLILDVTVDLSTTRLQRLIQAAELSGVLPATSGKDLVRRARAVRAYVEAGELGLAKTTVEGLAAAVPAAEYPDLSAAIKRQTDRTLTALK